MHEKEYAERESPLPSRRCEEKKAGAQGRTTGNHRNSPPMDYALPMPAMRNGSSPF